jgi:hypothetical protein
MFSAYRAFAPIKSIEVYQKTHIKKKGAQICGKADKRAANWLQSKRNEDDEK